MTGQSIDELRKDIETAWNDDKVAQQYARAEAATGPFADIMVQRSGLASLDGEANIFDLACGTGAVEAAIYKAVPKEKWDQLKVLGGDISDPMLAYLKARGEKEGWKGLELKIVNGTDIQLPPSTYTHFFVSFCLSYLPPTTLPACFNLLKPGGFAAINAWTYYPWSRLAGRALARIPGAPEYPPEKDIENKFNGGRPWDTPEYVEQVMKDAGFVDIKVSIEEREVDVGTPEELMEVMDLPLGLVSSFWEDEGRRKEWLEKLKKEMIVLGREDAGGEGKSLFMVFKAITGTGRKPS